MERLKASNRILRILYERRLEDFKERLEELKNPRIIYVSDLVACSHKRFFRMNYPELTLRFEPVTLMGELLHVGLEEILKDRGYSVEVSFERDVTVNEELYTLKGRVDAIGEGRVVEIKTGRPGQILPHPHHVLQLQVYLQLLDVPQGILVYITPDRITEYNVEREEINIEELAKETIEDTKHPRWEWECRYCYYSKMCPFRVEQHKV